MHYPSWHALVVPLLLSGCASVSSAPIVADRTDLIVSTNDAKYQRVLGAITYPPGRPSDSLNVIDASKFPPVIVATIDVAASVVGPPQSVAITPDGMLAVVSAPSRYDYVRSEVFMENYLQVVDLASKAPTAPVRVSLPAHPQALAINRAGTLLLATDLAGSVQAFRIRNRSISLVSSLQLSKGRLSGVSITPDGKSALVGLRDEGGVEVLDIDGEKVSPARVRLSTGIAPYSIDVASNGRLAVVGNVGLAGLAPTDSMLTADADSITLVDISKRPYRAIQHLTVPSVPEGVAISPDGKWIAVQCMDGSNQKVDHPARKARGKLVLFEVRNDEAARVGELPAGESSQGVVFTADSRHILVQFNVEQQIAVYSIEAGRLTDTGVRLPVAGGPASIRSMPR